MNNTIILIKHIAWYNYVKKRSKNQVPVEDR